MPVLLKYIELKTNQADKGPAWIARVRLSKSRRTVYFDGRPLEPTDPTTFTAPENAKRQCP